MTNLVSIITLTHNNLAYTRRCVASLLHTVYRQWELIVVENGSSDGTLEWLKEFKQTAADSGVKVTIIENKKNIGCSTARNQGIEKAAGSRIVFVDNDVAVRNKNWLTGLSAVLDQGPDIGIVGPKLVYPFPPHAIQFAGGAVSRTGKVQFIGRGEPRHHPRFNTRHEVQFFISACWMMKRSTLDDVGGFDEAFNPVQFEDTDLCYRIRSKGYRILYEPSVEMYHFESATTGSVGKAANAAVVVRHGLLFKERWEHMFENENGPPDEDTRWREIETVKLESIGELEMI